MVGAGVLSLPSAMASLGWYYTTSHTPIGRTLFCFVIFLILQMIDRLRNATKGVEKS